MSQSHRGIGVCEWPLCLTVFLLISGCRTAGNGGQERETAADVEVSQPQPPRKPPATPSTETRPDFQQESPKSQ